MNITIKAIHFTADKRLEQFIENKLNKLKKYDDRILGANVFLKLVKKQEVDNKITEIKLDIPGTDLFAKKQTDSFEKSTDTVVEALKKQLQKFKEKQRQ